MMKEERDDDGADGNSADCNMMMMIATLTAKIYEALTIYQELCTHYVKQEIYYCVSFADEEVDT